MKRIFSILFFIWIAVLTQTVSAEEPAVVRVGYYENEIFQEGAEDGVIKRGYAYEYYRKLSEYTGWKYEYVYGSYNELYQKLLDGEIDFLAGLAKTDDRKGLIGYPAAAMGSETYNLIKHAADESITNDFATLANKRIGVLDGAMVGALNKFLNDHGVNATVVTYGDYQDLLDAFDNNVINVIAVEGSGTYGRAHAELLYTFGSTDYYLCVDIRNKELLKELNNTQRKLAAEEPFYLYMLRMKYYPAAISSKAFSSDEQEWLKHHDTLKIGYLKNYLPYSDMDETGNVTGLLKDLLPSMLEAMDIQNLKIEYKAYDSYDDMIADLENRTLDVAFPVGGGIYFLEENGVSPTNAVLYSRTELIYRGMHSSDEVSSFAVNTNNRMQYYYVKANFPNAEIVEFSSTEDCLAAVRDGRVQATTLNEFRAGSILKNRRFRELSMKPLPHSEERAFGVHVGNSGLLKLLNRGLNVVGKERPEKIVYNYVDNLYSYTLYDMFMDNQWLFALIVAALAALVTWFFARKSKRERERLIHVVASLADAIDAKDAYTNGHSRRVAEYSREIARRFGYDENAQSKVYMMGLLHDVGKIGVPDAVINKTGKLTDEEFELIKAHPGIGSRILENIREMPELSAGARWHHERYNGRGYPDGLAGKDIPEEARIIAVADAYDAMSSNRSYRNTLPQEVIRGEIEKGKGGQFDPTFADIMLAMIDEDKDYNMRDKR
ncbi:MAG: transporter substrate-binding domain-containing protein [Schwartzia succinivorans]|uniref:HD domain-containing phosphohydrolase n=1 Tax=Schwartzia succinivorans TaxID=55507 RepID=UPI002356E835|nr:HD domain-containing phosphohydrolase [Schwartzia succinivorans]MBE6096881.1 transporter substrate-binding domain-containing protein [Schwartzia succinivorans]